MDEDEEEDGEGEVEDSGVAQDTIPTGDGKPSTRSAVELVLTRLLAGAGAFDRLW